MFNKKLKDISNSKLEKTVNHLIQNQEIDKTGFVKKSTKTSLFKTKSFRLREADLLNFENITSYINNNNDRMKYSDSQILRGLINYLSDNMDNNFKKILPYVRTSS
ncbi:MAG: hypothetical protein AB8B67_04650 [Rickettsiaceae bacterium]